MPFAPIGPTPEKLVFARANSVDRIGLSCVVLGTNIGSFRRNADDQCSHDTPSSGWILRDQTFRTPALPSAPELRNHADLSPKAGYYLSGVVLRAVRPREWKNRIATRRKSSGISERHAQYCVTRRTNTLVAAKLLVPFGSLFMDPGMP